MVDGKKVKELFCRCRCVKMHYALHKKQKEKEKITIGIESSSIFQSKTETNSKHLFLNVCVFFCFHLLYSFSLSLSLSFHFISVSCVFWCAFYFICSNIVFLGFSNNLCGQQEALPILHTLQWKIKAYDIPTSEKKMRTKKRLCTHLVNVSKRTVGKWQTHQWGKSGIW